MAEVRERESSLYKNKKGGKYPLHERIFFLLLWNLWGIERSGFFNGREKWAKGFENQRV